MTVRRHGALAVAVVALLAACGLGEDRRPRPISEAEAPIDLASPAGGPTTAPTGNAEVVLYFVREGSRLQSTERAAANTGIQAAIEALLGGPGPDETDLRTSIPLDTVLRSEVLVDAGVATINLGCETETGSAAPDACGILGVAGTDQLVAFAQLVCTANEVRGIDHVLFQQEGQPQVAPTDAGPLSEPVDCNDYQSVQEE